LSKASDALDTDLRTSYSRSTDMRDSMMVVDVKNPHSSLTGAHGLAQPRVNETATSEKGNVCLHNDE
jgi:hypothetical protein